MRLLTWFALALGAVGVTACSAQPSTSAANLPPATGRSSAPTSAPTGSTTPSAPSSPSTVASPTSAGAPSCATAELRLSTGSAGGAAGTTYQQLRLVNVGAKTCTMFGYPGVSFLDGSGRQLGLAAARDKSAAAHEVVVRAGAAARFTVAIPNAGIFDSSTCQPAQAVAVRVYPPSERSALRVGYRTTICTTSSGQARVGVVN